MPSLVALEMTPREIAILRSLARVSEKACARAAVLSPRGWERDLYLRQEALHRQVAARLEGAVPPAALAYPFDIDDAWDGLED